MRFFRKTVHCVNKYTIFLDKVVFGTYVYHIPSTVGVKKHSFFTQNSKICSIGILTLSNISTTSLWPLKQAMQSGEYLVTGCMRPSASVVSNAFTISLRPNSHTLKSHLLILTRLILKIKLKCVYCDDMRNLKFEEGDLHGK